MKWQERIANRNWVRKLLESPPDLEILRKRPSTRFLVGVGLICLSYAMCWPVIAALTWLSARLANPLVVGVGGPVIYGASHCTFLLGMYVAGPDCLNRSRALLRLLVYRFCRRVLKLDPSAIHDGGDRPV